LLYSTKPNHCLKQKKKIKIITIIKIKLINKK
jgi:hypothetical protein